MADLATDRQTPPGSAAIGSERQLRRPPDRRRLRLQHGAHPRRLRDPRRLPTRPPLLDRRGFLTLFLLSAVPNPLFDVAGLTAGSLGYSPWRYWLAVALGKSIVYVVLALGGQTLIPRIL